MKILAPSDEDLNEPFPSGKTPYEYALEHKSVELIKILAPKIKNPNARYSPGRWIPIWRAIELGHNEIVEILAPLVENPNKSNSRCTNICVATGRGNIEAVKILAPLVKNPNFCGCGCTPICKATQQGTMDCINSCRLNEGCNFATHLSNCGPKDCINCLFFKTCEKLDSNTCPNCLTSSTACPQPPQCDVPGICTVSYTEIRPHSSLIVDISHIFFRENFCILKL